MGNIGGREMVETDDLGVPTLMILLFSDLPRHRDASLSPLSVLLVLAHICSWGLELEYMPSVL